MVLSWFGRGGRAFLRFLSCGKSETGHTEISRLCRRYSIWAACAVVILLVFAYLNLRLGRWLVALHDGMAGEAYTTFPRLSLFAYFFAWVGIAVLTVVIFNGFALAKRAAANARKHEDVLQEAKQRTVEIAALYDITQDVSSRHDLAALLKSIALRATTLLGGAGCAIFLYDADRDDFQIAVESGVGMPIGTRLSSHEGLGGRVAETLQPVIVNDYQNWPHRARALMQLPIGATVCVPMIRRGELIGVLGVHEVVGSKRTFTDADARLLSLFADNAAGAVYNARLMDALRNSEERFRIAAECASDIVYDWDLTDNRVAFFGTLFGKNWGGEACLPKTREEYASMIHPEDRGLVQEAVRKHLESNEPFSLEYRIMDSRGACLTVSDRATAIRDVGGTATRMIGVVSDITERKKAEKMKSDFVSFVTHQLRTPLSGIRWMLELAGGEAEDLEAVRSYVQDARASTERLIRLVNDLLDVSRLERGTIPVQIRDVDLAELTRSIIAEMSPLVREKEQAVSFEMEDGVAAARADAQMLRQIVLNLFSNAVKYTPRGGRITVGLRRIDDKLHWEVADTGIGIPRSDLPKLFEKFYRAENAQAVETEGTGLGLYLVRLLVERLGGKVWCISDEGIGSTFAFTIPLSSREA